MGCPLKELDTSALSASPRRLTEGVLEVEGPTSADAGVASCLLLNAEPVFRRLRDDLFDEILLVGMIELAVGQTQQVRDDGFLINGSSINDSCSPMSS